MASAEPHLTGNIYVYGVDLISKTDGRGAPGYYLTDGLSSTSGISDDTAP